MEIRDVLPRACRKALLVALLCAPLLAFAQASANVSSTSDAFLREAAFSAWRKQPQSQAADQRRAEFAARLRAAEAFSRDAPAVTIENWSDRWTMRNGFAKYAGEFALPLWLPGERAQTKATIASELAYFEAVVKATEVRLAGEVREAFWALANTRVDRAIANLRLEEAQRLQVDLERRLRAGVSARTDSQSAMAQVQLARAGLANAEQVVFRAERSFMQLTGLPPPGSTPTADGISTPAPAPGNAELAVGQHPALLALQLAETAARSALKLAALTNRDSPELGVGAFRERSTSLSPFENILTLRLRIPLATEARNAPRVAQANVALIEALSQSQLEQGRLLSEIEIAQREHDLSTIPLEAAKRRLALAIDNDQLISKAFALGEADFATRLRVQSERIDAELMLQRASLERQRAASRLLQAQGLLP
jgi:outer membrane protein, heavy metal efflux system